MKNLLKTITNKNNIIFYDFRCDDKRKNKKIPTDKSFCLSDVKNVNKLLNICNNLKLNYDLVVVHWNEKEQEICKEIYLIGNNFKNN